MIFSLLIANVNVSLFLVVNILFFKYTVGFIYADFFLFI
jgi:hypothetical protein